MVTLTPSWTTVSGRTETARSAMTCSSTTGETASWLTVVGKMSPPVGVGAGVKKGKGVLLLHSGTHVGQSERVRRGVAPVSSAATIAASPATATKVMILANILSIGWLGYWY